MNIFISGGCKNGKSYYAQRRAKDMASEKGVPLYYVATMIPRDEEDNRRIKRHISERAGWGFETIEQGKALTGILHDDSIDKNGIFLLDSITALLDNEMFGGSGEMDETAADRVKRDVLEFAEATGNTVFVSDYIYSDAELYDESVESYRRGLAAVDRALAEICDQVMEIGFGIEERWK